VSDEILPTRWTLLSRLKERDDQESWRTFFETYWEFIYRTATKCGLTHHEAQEVVQEVVLSVSKTIGEFRTNPEGGSFKSWLLKITKWRITDQFRKRARDQRFRTTSVETATGTGTGTIERIPDPASVSVEKTWESDWQQNLVQIAMDRVKSQVKAEVFQRFDLLVNQGWTAARVATRLHVTQAQVYFSKVKVVYLLKRELAKLERNGF
jgi:RNA polymerase sigma-70 factor (ECF subfamily)